MPPVSRALQVLALSMAAGGQVTLPALPPPPPGTAIRVLLFGTGGGPAPNPTRGGPSALVEAGGERLFVDAGRSVVQRMAQAGVLPGQITRLFVTHLHSDHTIGVVDLWLSGWWNFRDAPLEMRGPAGTRAMAQHLRQAYAADIELRAAAPERLSRRTAALVGIDVADGIVYETNGVRVTAIAVDHGPVPTLGYRFDYGGHSVVFSGDDRKSENLIARSQNVDVLFHPMTAFTDAELREEGRGGDRRRAAAQLLASPEEAADVFARSHCKVAILIHATPGDAALARVRSVYSGRLETLDDLTEVSVGTDVTIRRLTDR
jgi:ribonuclease Z